ncbi:MAG TPA: GTPase ObgE [Candidatus Moranbacteria bacterium]|nr:GTPase ObgE [Candidatus Moranbacteria bacterium]
MLIDDVTIKISAGKGGDGVVGFDKNKFALGPTGARGGNGGNVYFVATDDIGALRAYRHQKSFAAESGKIAGYDLRDGRKGRDLELRAPIGTVIHNLITDKKIELTKVGEKTLVLKGGLGGRGNWFFRSPSNTTPKEFEVGKEGQKGKFRLELKLIADVGLVGFPNAGKSTFLNIVTAAKSKVANYPFTTLEPHLGSYYGLIIADIPGIIEGASTGKGLGTKFLRHIERTKNIFHFISAESEDPVADYQTIRTELEKHNPDLIKKTEYVFLSKIDTVPPQKAQKKLALLKKENPNTLPLSSIDDESIEKVKKILNKIKDQRFIAKKVVK